MEEIKGKIDQTITGLREKRAILLRHKKQYVDLKFQLYDYQQYHQNRKTPELTVQMTSKARVKAHVIDPSQILVFLGCEYFVERSPAQAIVLVENKLKYLQQAIDEFESKIKDAGRTLGNIDTLMEFQEKDQRDKSKQKQQGQSTGVELNEESLPFMDIREELDEDGNVISSKVEPQDQERLKEFTSEHGIESLDEHEELKQLLKEMEITPRDQEKSIVIPKIEEIQEVDVEESSEDIKEEDLGEESNEQDYIEEDVQEEESLPVETTIEESNTTTDNGYFALFKEMGIVNKPNEYFSLFKEMGIVNKSDVQTAPSPIPEQSPPSTEQKPAVDDHPQQEPTALSKGAQPPVTELNATTSTTTTTINASEIHDPEALLDQLEKYDPSQPAIEDDDIMQLQLITDDFEEEESDDYDEDGKLKYGFDKDGFEYGFDQDDSNDDDDDDDDDEDDDEDDDWEFTHDENMVPDSYRELFAKELEKLRGTRHGSNTNDIEEVETPVVTTTTTTTTTTTPSEEKVRRKKSVSFANELQIKEIENVSEQLKEAGQAQLKVSKFKQMKQMRGTSHSSRDIIEQEGDKPLNDIVEKEQSVQPMPVTQKKSISIIGDIIENDTVTESVEPPKRLSKFKSSLSSIKPSRSKASTIIESEFVPIRQKIQEDTSTTTSTTTTTPSDQQPQRLSKFKSSRSTTSIPTPTTTAHPDPKKTETIIHIPIDTYEPTPETEYNNIKAYALNDEEDEDLLNAITENMVVYNPDDDEDDEEEDGVEYRDPNEESDEEGEGEGEAPVGDEKENDEDGPMMLDKIVEKDDVDEPSYFVDDNILAKEYHDLRRKMFDTYGDKQREAESRIIFKEDEGQELEPIDEYGNPVKVSKFRKGMKKV